MRQTEKKFDTRAHEKGHHWLTRTKALLQSDLCSVDTRPNDRPEDEALLAERARLRLGFFFMPYMGEIRWEFTL